jgi:hypothetical protein
MALAALLHKISSRQRLWVIAVAVISAVAIPLSLFIATRYTMGEYAPLRAFSVPTTLFALCLSIIVAAATTFLISPIKQTSNHWINPALVVATILISLSAIQASLPTLQAVAMRANLYDSRDEAIQEQLASHQKTIYITPLPVLLDNTDAVDLYYNSHTPSWLAGAFRQYYNIPNDTLLVFDSQPEGYCVEYKNPIWFGTKTCNELDK